MTFTFDHLRMEQVFDNLLANALNFTPEGGKVEVWLNLNPRGLLEIGFQDTGPGIPPKYHKAVFSKFFQVDTEGPHRGTGLGLSIVKHIVEAHGGRVELSSELSQGAKFILLFPAGRTPNKEMA
jgi:signal transduction histidine kinase